MIVRPAAVAYLLLLVGIVSTTGFTPQQRMASAWIHSSVGRESRSRLLDVVNDELPDYGKTSVEIDKIEIEKKDRWRRKHLFGSSIIDQTLQELQTDIEFQATAKRLETLGQDGMTKEERTRRRRALANLGVPPFAEFLRQKMGDSYQLVRPEPTIFQINIGLYCNQACSHCHVESSPLRTQEMMNAETAARCVQLLRDSPSIKTLDITGGAPELNVHFRYLVKMARALRPDLQIIDRCNLTVLQEPGQEDLVDFLKANQVHIVASLPGIRYQFAIPGAFDR